METPLPAEFQRIVDRARAHERERISKDLGALLALQIESYAQLVSALPHLNGKERSTALWALPHFGKTKALRPLLGLLGDPDPSVRAKAVYTLKRVGGIRAAKALVRHLENDPDGAVREMAAHGLGFLFDDRVTHLVYEPLLRALENERELPGVRAQAAESLGNLLAYEDKRTPRFRQALQALLRALDHPAPEVRFWACFALGTIQSRRALPKLRRIIENDTDICPGWWAVKDEASDAVEYILTGNWPDRERLPYPGTAA